MFVVLLLEVDPSLGIGHPLLEVRRVQRDEPRDKQLHGVLDELLIQGFAELVRLVALQEIKERYRSHSETRLCALAPTARDCP